MENLRPDFHIVSWNVAGWSKTIEKIKLKHGTFENWLNKHSIDILCIQEVKISSKDLCLKKNEYGACLNDFDSFWAFPDPNKSKQKSGLNGVTTFVKKGLIVKAQSNIFGDDTLDSEGRCIMTDHGGFVVFNVYVPYRGQNFVRLPFKIKFLEKLRDVMKVQRSMGKKVILAGDLNVAPRSQDCFRGYRKLNLSSMINDLKFTDVGCIYRNNFKYIAQPELLKLKCFVDYLIDKWPDVKNSLESSLAIEEDTSGKSKVYYISAIRNSDGKRVRLGRNYSFNPIHEYRIDDYIIPENITEDLPSVEVRRANTLEIIDWKEVLCKLGNLNGKVDMNKNDWNALADIFGEPCHDIQSINWLRSLIENDNMVNTFEMVWPHVHGRYTCWNQQENKRYYNEGNRIDHIIIDKSLWEESGITETNIPLEGFKEVSENQQEECSACDLEHLAALHACTAGGLFRMAPFDGGGIPESSPLAYEHQFTAAKTGMIYTPPDYSDHIAVSLLLKSGCLPSDLPLLLQKDSFTKATQPFTSQTSIRSFFAVKSSTKLNVEENSASICLIPKKRSLESRI